VNPVERQNHGPAVSVWRVWGKGRSTLVAASTGTEALAEAEARIGVSRIVLRGMIAVSHTLAVVDRIRTALDEARAESLALEARFGVKSLMARREDE
jgi:hypothetical protein